MLALKLTLYLDLIVAQFAANMTPDELRGLMPLIYKHVNSYGLFLLNMSERRLGNEEAVA